MNFMKARDETHFRRCVHSEASRTQGSLRGKGRKKREVDLNPGVDTICGLSLVVGSLLCSARFFSGYSGFPLSSKTNTSKFQFDLERTDTFQRVHMNSYVLRG